MFVWLLALPAALKVAIGGLVLLVALQVGHWWQVRGLRNQIEDLTVSLDKERAASAQLRVSLSDLERNRDELADEIAKQSAAIAEIQVRATQQAQRARADALAQIRAAERRAEELRNVATSTVPPGHDNMNAWLVSRFMQ